jgi:Dolichyl-phosphate-mannose-protein mannosyltransferase
LPIIGGGFNSNVSGLGESGEAGETEQDQPDETGFAQRIRADAYRNHNKYDSNKQRLCHRSGRKLHIGNTSESGKLRRPLVKPNSANYDGSLLRVAAWAVLAAAIVAVLCARIHLRGLPLERDEGEYAYCGQLLLHGIPPYKLAYSMKFPGTAGVYAVVMSVFGESIAGIRIGLLLANLVTILLIYLLGQKLMGELGAIATAASYSVLSLMPHVLGNAAHATHFVVLFTVAGTLVLIRAIDRQSSLLIFISGGLFGLAVLMKQPGLFFALFGLSYLFTHDWIAKLKLEKILYRNLAFIFGLAIPCLITGAALWSAGVFGKFWFWTIKYATQYGSQVSAREGLQIFGDHFLGVVGTAWPIWTLSLIGLIAGIIDQAVRPRAVFVIAFAFFSGLAVCPGFYFRPHYFILLLPAISLLTGAAVVSALNVLQLKFRFVVLAVLAGCVAWPLWSERDFFFERPLVEANRLVNGTNPFPESIKIAEFIRTQSGPTDTIAVLGSEPQIYFYARRLSATGYIYTYALMEPQPYAHQMQEEMIHEIETARPRFLILVVINKSWLAGLDSDQTIFKWANAYREVDYEEIGLINIFDWGSDYYLSPSAAVVTPAAEHILIYRRKT